MQFHEIQHSFAEIQRVQKSLVEFSRASKHPSEFVKFTIILSKGIPSLVNISNNPVKDANCKSLAKKEEFLMLLSVISNLPVNKFNSLKYKVAVPSPSIKDSDIEDLFKNFPKSSNSIFILFNSDC